MIDTSEDVVVTLPEILLALVLEKTTAPEVVVVDDDCCELGTVRMLEEPFVDVVASIGVDEILELLVVAVVDSTDCVIVEKLLELLAATTEVDEVLEPLVVDVIDPGICVVVVSVRSLEVVVNDVELPGLSEVLKKPGVIAVVMDVGSALEVLLDTDSSDVLAGVAEVMSVDARPASVAEL